MFIVVLPSIVFPLGCFVISVGFTHVLKLFSENSCLLVHLVFQQVFQDGKWIQELKTCVAFRRLGASVGLPRSGAASRRPPNPLPFPTPPPSALHPFNSNHKEGKGKPHNPWSRFPNLYHAAVLDQSFNNAWKQVVLLALAVCLFRMKQSSAVSLSSFFLLCWIYIKNRICNGVFDEAILRYIDRFFLLIFVFINSPSAFNLSFCLANTA